MNLSLRSNSKDKSFLEIQGVQTEKEEQKAPSFDQAPPRTTSSNPCYAWHWVGSPATPPSHSEIPRISFLGI